MAFNIICGFRHPQGILEWIPWGYGDYCILLRKPLKTTTVGCGVRSTYRCLRLVGKEAVVLTVRGSKLFGGIHRYQALSKGPIRMQVFWVISLLFNPPHLVAISFWADRKQTTKTTFPFLSASIVFLEDLSGCLPEYALNSQSIQVENMLISKLWLWQNKFLQPFIKKIFL